MILIPKTSVLQFFSDVKEAEERMKKMEDTMKKKYVCDRSITVTRLEDLLQDAVVGVNTCGILQPCIYQNVHELFI